MKNKQVILIGEGCFFADNFLFFKEHGFNLKVIRTKNKLEYFCANYNLFEQLGAQIIDFSETQNFYKSLELSPQTLIVTGGHFGGGKLFLPMQKVDTEELDILYNITKFNFDNNLQAKSLRYFNGDTNFGDEKILLDFKQKTHYVDAFLFDNDLLRDMVLLNVPEIKNKKILLGWFETPLERFVKHNTSACFEKSFLSLGRILCSTPKEFQKLKPLLYPNPHLWHRKKINQLFIKFKHCFLNRRKLFYHLANGENYNEILADRIHFFMHHQCICFGISHFYDVFRGSVTDFHKNTHLDLSPQGQNIPHNPFTDKPAYYAFCNNPSKDLCYLMNGIIPLISHDEHSLYKELIKRKMAFLIKSPQDLVNLKNLSNKEIQTYRDNIFNNRELFTFEPVGNMLLKEFQFCE